MKTIRYFKKVGLGFKTPSDAIQGNYIDKKCPFTGNVSIRGRIIKGMVLSTKMKNTIIVRSYALSSLCQKTPKISKASS